MTVESQQSCHFRNTHIRFLQITQGHFQALITYQFRGRKLGYSFDFAIEIGATNTDLVTKHLYAQILVRYILLYNLIQFL